MKIVDSNYEIISDISEGGKKELREIEDASRTCYKSKNKDDFEKTKVMVKSLINNGHEAMLEHSKLSVRFISDRGFSHEIVRHRLFSFAQESTRYCNYSKDKFGGDVSFINLCEQAFMEEQFQKLPKTKQSYILGIWKKHMDDCEKTYNSLLSLGATPQIARSVLPNSLKTEIVVTGNYREWRNYFKLRVAPNAHPIMRYINIPLILELNERIPIIFEDIIEKYALDKEVNKIELDEELV